MTTVEYFLENVRDYAVEKYETEEELREDLRAIVKDKYNGDFHTFMKEEVLNEDYGTLRHLVNELYMD